MRLLRLRQSPVLSLVEVLAEVLGGSRVVQVALNSSKTAAACCRTLCNFESSISIVLEIKLKKIIFVKV